MPTAAEEASVKNKIMKELNRHPFRPAWWLRNRHAQTIYVGLVRKQLGHIGAPKMRRERWDTPDGDFLDLIFLDGRKDAPLVVLFHGMEGSHRSYYIPGYAKQFARLGWNFVVMFFRSCGFEMNRTSKLYHLGSTEDPEFVLQKLRERYPNQPRFAIGISLGGNVLSKWMGQQGDAAREFLDAAVVISPPVEPVTVAPTFHKLLWGFYAYHFVRTLKPKALDVLRRYPGLLDEEAVKKAYNFYTFDDAVTSKLNGYKDAVDYWEQNDCGRFLADIRVPTLLIISGDDQFILPACMPRETSDNSPYLYPQFTDKGGHAAFVSGPLPCSARYWYEEQSLRFLKAQLQRCAGAVPDAQESVRGSIRTCGSSAST
ncbi:MAG: alpha/beta fold hydrolase [Candidatus Hydrogenedentes bacterium]|nr:alpha/beta fold hydrolase [Candidatus Hydrogenedentota bacterium]